jgi:hypothetical protein
MDAPVGVLLDQRDGWERRQAQADAQAELARRGHQRLELLIVLLGQPAAVPAQREVGPHEVGMHHLRPSLRRGVQVAGEGHPAYLTDPRRDGQGIGVGGKRGPVARQPGRDERADQEAAPRGGKGHRDTSLWGSRCI